jgi:hypothetical protein
MLARLKPSPFKAIGTSGTLAYIAWLGGRGRPPLRGLCRFPGRTRVCASMLAGRKAILHSSSQTVSSKDARLALYCNRVPRLRAVARPGPFLAQKRHSFRMTILMSARLKPSPFKATARAGRSRLHYMAGRTRASAPTWTVLIPRWTRVCASMFGGRDAAPDQYKAKNVGQECPTHTSQALAGEAPRSLLIRMLASRHTATAFGRAPSASLGISARGSDAAQTPQLHSRKSGARSG